MGIMKQGTIKFNDMKDYIMKARDCLKSSNETYVLTNSDGELKKLPAAESISLMAQLLDDYNKDGVIDSESMKKDLELTKPRELKLFNELLEPYIEKNQRLIPEDDVISVMRKYEHALIQANGEYVLKACNEPTVRNSSVGSNGLMQSRQNLLTLPTSDNLEKQMLKLEYSTPDKNEKNSKDSAFNLAKLSIKELSAPSPVPEELLKRVLTNLGKQ